MNESSLKIKENSSLTGWYTELSREFQAVIRKIKYDGLDVFLKKHTSIVCRTTGYGWSENEVEEFVFFGLYGESKDYQENRLLRVSGTREEFEYALGRSGLRYPDCYDYRFKLLNEPWSYKL